MRYVIVYLKAQQGKDGELSFEGPVLGPVAETKDSAEAEARKIVSSMPRFAVMPKIYEIENTTDPKTVLSEASKHFAVLRDNIVESKEIMDKPIMRSKKKKKKN